MCRIFSPNYFFCKKNIITFAPKMLDVLVGNAKLNLFASAIDEYESLLKRCLGFVSFALPKAVFQKQGCR